MTTDHSYSSMSEMRDAIIGLMRQQCALDTRMEQLASAERCHTAMTGRHLHRIETLVCSAETLAHIQRDVVELKRDVRCLAETQQRVHELCATIYANSAQDREVQKKATTDARDALARVDVRLGEHLGYISMQVQSLPTLIDQSITGLLRAAVEQALLATRLRATDSSGTEGGGGSAEGAGSVDSVVRDFTGGVRNPADLQHLAGLACANDDVPDQNGSAAGGRPVALVDQSGPPQQPTTPKMETAPAVSPQAEGTFTGEAPASSPVTVPADAAPITQQTLASLREDESFEHVSRTRSDVASRMSYVEI